MKIELQPTTKIRSVLGTPKDIVLVDSSWLLHRSFHAYNNLSASVGGVPVVTGDIFGFMRSIGSIIKRRPQSAVILCMDDRTEATDRKKKHEGYKENREGNRDVYLKIDEVLATASLLPCVFIAWKAGLEADDHLFSLAKALSPAMENVYIYCGDNDLLQAVGGNVYVFRKMHQRGFDLLGEEYVVEKFGVGSKGLAMLRSIRGDSSDNLKGYSRFPSKLAIAIATRWSDAPVFLSEAKQHGWEPKDWSWVKKIVEDPSILIRNWELMKLRRLTASHLYTALGSWNAIRKYNMRSIETLWTQILESVPA